MKIIATSDMHGNLPEIPECDLLLIAGDVCPVVCHDLAYQSVWLGMQLCEWLEDVPAKHIVGISGNHDWAFFDGIQPDLPWTYLQDSGCEVQGLKIWGTPWQPPFFDWAFNAPENELESHFSKIPKGLDILISHGPPHGTADRNAQGEHCGSLALRDAIQVKQPKLVVCGHIHEAFGAYQMGETEVWSVSLVDGDYRVTREPVEVGANLEQKERE